MITREKKKTFHPQGRKAISWYHPVFPQFKYHRARKSLVDLRGFEPLTSSMPWRRSPSCATGPCEDPWPTNESINSFYALTGVPTSARLLYSIACKAVEVGLHPYCSQASSVNYVAALQQLAALCKGVDLLLLLIAFIFHCVSTIP
jgi:hypothetical protein